MTCIDIYIDIETVARPIEFARDYLAEVEAKARDELKLESAIQERIVRAKSKWGLALDGFEIACVGVAAQDLHLCFPTDVSIEAPTEKHTLEQLVAFLSQFEMNLHRLIGYNLKAFDLPRIAIALARHGLEWPLAVLPGSSYGSERVLDLMNDPNGKAMGIFGSTPSLDAYSRAYGLGVKQFNAKKTTEMWLTVEGRQQLMAGCMWDIERTMLLHKKFQLMYHI